MRSRFLLTCLAIAAVIDAAAQSPGQERHKGHAHSEENKPFENPDLDVQEYVKRFETDSREIYRLRREIAEAAALRPGMAVADIGSGTGLFAWLFAERVGSKGKVYAVEIAPAFLKYIGDQARKRGLEKVVETVRGTQESTNLKPSSIDVAFVCATYHHFEHPEEMLTSIHAALRPGGRLVVIDFDLRADSSEFVRKHARAPKEEYFREIEAAGFSRIEPQGAPALSENFLAGFQRIEPEDSRTDRPSSKGNR